MSDDFHDPWVKRAELQVLADYCEERNLDKIAYLLRRSNPSNGSKLTLCIMPACGWTWKQHGALNQELCFLVGDRLREAMRLAHFEPHSKFLHALDRKSSAGLREKCGEELKNGTKLLRSASLHRWVDHAWRHAAMAVFYLTQRSPVPGAERLKKFAQACNVLEDAPPWTYKGFNKRQTRESRSVRNQIIGQRENHAFTGCILQVLWNHEKILQEAIGCSST